MAPTFLHLNSRLLKQTPTEEPEHEKTPFPSTEEQESSTGRFRVDDNEHMHGSLQISDIYPLTNPIASCQFLLANKYWETVGREGITRTQVRFSETFKQHHVYNCVGFVKAPRSAVQNHEITVHTKDRRARSVTINVNICDLRPQPPTKKGHKFILRPTDNCPQIGSIYVATKVEKAKHEVVVARGGQRTRFCDDTTVRVLTEEEDS